MSKKDIKNITRLKSINVVKFRGLKDVTLEFGERITAICGKNGTSKSTILGILGQIFSFREDATISPHEDLKLYKTLTDKMFESSFSEHFRFSKEHDKKGDMDVRISIYDGYTNRLLTNPKLGLTLSTDRPLPRPVVRGNDTIEGKNTSRNITHPVIFLSLQRLLPISSREEYKVRDVEFIKKNEKEIKALSNQLLLKTKSNLVTATTGTIKSMVVHTEQYDQESVSVGEDNIGQIVQAIYSFIKLSKEYSNYHGGMILIDEADAGLFPAAQVEFVEALIKICSKYNLQVIFTTHSPTLIQTLHNYSKKDSKNYKVLYLTDSYGRLQVMENFSWLDINSDLLVQAKTISDKLKLPKVNVYFEDKQAFDMYNALIRKTKIRQVVNPLKDISISCTKLMDLMAHQLSEFVSKSIIVLDGDVKNDISSNAKKAKRCQNLALLPTSLAPDQILFETLYNLPANDAYWKNNKAGVNKPIFERAAREVIEHLNITSDNIDLEDVIKSSSSRNNDGDKTRDLFKRFSKNKNIIELINGPIKFNPYTLWSENNPQEASEFVSQFEKCLFYTLHKGFNVDELNLASLFESK
ncbi:TPA: AAA family ATPase [Providencia rettgeri]